MSCIIHGAHDFLDPIMNFYFHPGKGLETA